MKSLADGFAVIANCFSESECEALIAKLGPSPGVGTRCLLDHDWCQDLAVSLRSRIAAAVPEIRSLGAVQCTFFNKSADNNWFVAFHQDRSVPVSAATSTKGSGGSQKEGMTFVHGTDELLARMIAVRLHLDNSTPDNGPLRVIPGSHTAGTLSPHEIAVRRDLGNDRPLVIDRGGLILMRPLLLHASSKSRALTSRRVLHFLFAPRSQLDGLEWRRAV